MTVKPKDRLFIALDVDDLKAADHLMSRMQGVVSQYKLGAQLLTAAGPEAVMHVRRRGFGVFYDAKFHDIPRTVGASVAAACRIGATIVNVHAGGGKDMMAAAAQAARDVAHKLRQPRTLVLGVTVLTSLTQANLTRELGVRRRLQSQVVQLARLAKASGLDGVVASPQEIAAVRRACGRDFVILTPGIRPAGASLNDQKRTLTPGQAMAAGADYLVVGRPVYEARDPLAVVRSIFSEMEEFMR
ncbi:MAG: orotidine-5'-phosphate decarboxylase [candidate division FCPU426 bacterium]